MFFEFHHDAIRQYTVIFGSLFNQITIQRDNADGTKAEILKVPIGYGPSDKFLSRVLEQPLSGAPFAGITLPRIAFEFIDFNYDSNRKLNNLNKIRTGSSSVYNPVPYDFIFELYIMTKNTVDGTRIIEQILPYFTPQFNIPVKVLATMGITDNVPIVLQGVSKTDNYEGSYEERRTQIWTLRFNVKGYLYGPVVSSNSVIKQAEIRIFNGLDQSQKTETMIVNAGQTANGVATKTRPPGVVYNLVDPNLPWSFITQFDYSTP